MPHADLAPTRRALVTRASALALLGSTTSVEAAAHGDAELLRLGVLFEAAWKVQRIAADKLNAECASGNDDDAIWEHHDALHDATNTIVRQIEVIQATTLAGLVVKARACFWTHSGEPIEPHFFSYDRNSPSTDARLGAAIVRDLLALASPSIGSA